MDEVDKKRNVVEGRGGRILRNPPLASGRDVFPTLSTALAHYNSGGQEAFTGDWYIVEEVCGGCGDTEA